MIFIGLAVMNSCKKDQLLTPTSLVLSLKDNLGNAVSGVSIKLYSSKTDWDSGSNQIGTTQISDSSGKVKFNGLSNLKYYWLAEKDCQNNVNGLVTTAVALKANVDYTINVILSGTGILKFVSTSGNPYRIFVNGTDSFDMNSGTTQYKYYMPAGTYALRALQLSGYAISPYDSTYSGTLTCGSTLTTTFPSK